MLYIIGSLACFYLLNGLYYFIGILKLLKNSQHKINIANDHTPFVTIILSARNEADSIGKCLECLVNQTYPSNRYEIIPVNDASEDKTMEIINDYMLKNNRRNLEEINSSSMADIAFLLLVFFLVTTTISMDKGLSLVLPPVGEELEVNRKNITNILINESGKVLFDEKPAKAREISRLVTEKLRKNDKMIFSVQTHARTKYSDYIRVLDQLKIAKAKRISIANPE